MRKSNWKKFLPVLTVLFFVLVGYLLFQSLSTVDWERVQTALDNVSWATLAVASLLVFANYVILGSYDYLALRHQNVKFLGYPKVLLSAFICYAFTLNVGAFVGGLGFRYRIYSGWKVAKSKIPGLILYSTLSNWLGYTFLIGLVFMLRSELMEDLLPMRAVFVQGLGALALSGVLCYFILCARGKSVSVRGHDFTFPRVTNALLQLCLSTLQWSLLAGIINFLLVRLGSEVHYSQILVTLLMASIAGVITHIPAGLGVLETVFLRMNLNVPKSDLFVALICFRAVYYLLPLAMAIPSYFSLELYQKKQGNRMRLHRILNS